MHYGFRIVEDMIDGLSNYLDEKGFRSVNELIGRSLPSVSKWEELDLNYKIVAQHRPEEVHRLRALLRRLQRRRAPVDLGARRSTGARTARSSESTCVGCNLCTWSAPSTAASRMVRVDTGRPPLTWKEYQEDPGAHKHLGPHNAH